MSEEQHALIRAFNPALPAPRARPSAKFVGMVALLAACSSEPSDGGSSGGASNGGVVAAGGAQSGGAATNGGTLTSGGTSTSGGSIASGGASTSGGTPSNGGATASGGAVNGGSGGGSAATGGSSAGTTGGGVSSGGATAAGGASGGASGGAGGATTFALTSPNHADNAKFATKYTCGEAGFDKSILPELNWTSGPTGTKSYAITFIDTTLAPANTNGYHWVIYNIPANVQELPEGLKDATTINAKQSGPFLGPCPNFMSSGALKTDNYEFTLYALSSETFSAASGGVTAVTKDAQAKLEASNLASVKLKGTSDAKWPK